MSRRVFYLNLMATDGLPILIFQNQKRLAIIITSNKVIALYEESGALTERFTS